jgi:hypothetical protein
MANGLVPCTRPPPTLPPLTLPEEAGPGKPQKPTLPPPCLPQRDHAVPAGSKRRLRKGGHTAAAAALDAAMTVARAAGLAALAGTVRTPWGGDATPPGFGAGGGGETAPPRRLDELRASLTAQGSAVRALHERHATLLLARQLLAAAAPLQSLAARLRDSGPILGADELAAAVSGFHSHWKLVEACIVSMECGSRGATMATVRRSVDSMHRRCASTLRSAAVVIAGGLVSALRQEGRQPTSVATSALSSSAATYNACLRNLPPSGGDALPAVDVLVELARGRVAMLYGASVIAARGGSAVVAAQEGVAVAARELATAALGGSARGEVEAARRHVVDELTRSWPEWQLSAAVHATLQPDRQFALAAELPSELLGSAEVSIRRQLSARFAADALLADGLCAVSTDILLPKSPKDPLAWQKELDNSPSHMRPTKPWLSKVAAAVSSVLMRLEGEDGGGGRLAAGCFAGMFHSWAAQLLQRESLGLMELCTLYSDTAGVQATLLSLCQPSRHRAATDDGKAAPDDALESCSARLGLLHVTLRERIERDIVRSANSFFALLSQKHWCPAGRKVTPVPGDDERRALPAGEWAQRMVTQLMAPAYKSLAALEPQTAQELTPTFIELPLAELLALLLRTQPRFTDEGVRQLWTDTDHVRAWVRSIDGGSDCCGNGAQETVHLLPAPTSRSGRGNLPATQRLLDLSIFRRVESVLAVLGSPDDGALRTQVHDSAAWVKLRKRRPRGFGCSASIC